MRTKARLFHHRPIKEGHHYLVGIIHNCIVLFNIDVGHLEVSDMYKALINGSLFHTCLACEGRPSFPCGIESEWRQALLVGPMLEEFIDVGGNILRRGTPLVEVG